MMEKYRFDSQPRLRLLSEGDIKLIHEKALYILERTGVKFESKEALDILKEKGAVVDYDKKVAKINPRMVDDAVNNAPTGFKLFTREGELAADMSGNNIHFDPGSSLIKFMESDGKTIRSTQSEDLVRISRVNDALQNVHLQSTSVVCYDVPELIGDSYRLYLCLKNSPKAVITGAFTIPGVKHMRDMLAAVVGGEDELAAKPRAVFDICPSPPLKWTNISAQNIIDCARFGVPQELISLPMPGAATPITLAGSIVVHTAETLSGLVLAQSVNPGTVVVYGGAPVQFDMRYGTTPFSAIEATMISAAYAQMGKYFGMPTHTYAALSDSKVIDMQAGIETGISGVLAQLAGINMISGVGALDLVNTFSLEKLVIDHEVCGTVLRLQKGIDCSPDSLAIDVIDELGPGGVYLDHQHTLERLRTESFMPSTVLDRHDRGGWEAEGKKDTFARARERVKEIEENHKPEPLDEEREAKLNQVVLEIMKELKVESLPQGPA